MISNLITRPCTIVKPGIPTEDDYGNEIPGTPQLVETVCEFQRQTSRSESEDESRNQLSTSRWDVFFNDGEDVAEDYGLIVDDIEYQFDGPPTRVWNPLERRHTHIEATATRTAGADDGEDGS